MGVTLSTLRTLTASAALTALLCTQALAQPGMEIHWDEGLLSVKATNVPVSQLAEALGRETGIAVVVQGDTAAAISTEITSEPFEKAIAKLAPNHMLVHASKALNAEILEVVLIIADGGAQASGGEFLPTGAPADEIATSEVIPAAANPDPNATDPNADANADNSGVGKLRDKMRRLNARIAGSGANTLGSATTPTDTTTETTATQQQ